MLPTFKGSLRFPVKGCTKYWFDVSQPSLLTQEVFIDMYVHIYVYVYGFLAGAQNSDPDTAVESARLQRFCSAQLG